jgi:hypothetical protein
MPLKTKLIGLGIACFLIFVVALFPARVGFALLAPAEVSGFGINGSIWHGSARIINAGGMQLRNTEWNLALSRLLLGRFGGEFKTRWNNGFAEGFGTISLGGTLRLSETLASFDAAMLQPLLGTPSLGGQISLQLTKLELSDNWPHQLIGKSELRNLSSPLMGRGEAGLIGSLEVSFDTSTETESDTVTGKIRDIGGPIEATGTLLLIKPADYTLKARLKARPEAPAALQQNIEMLGSPEGDGTRIFQFAGSL